MSGMFAEGHTRAGRKSVEWYTPKWIFDELGLEFDLDPSSPFDAETVVPASVKYTVFDDGLKKPWIGRVWLNPPYGPSTGQWVDRMIDHGNGVALLFSRTDAQWCQRAMTSADAVLFLAGRIEFIPGEENKHKKGRCGAGTVMFAFGESNARALKNLSKFGVFYQLPKEKRAA